jgi:hypothetical protein
VRGRATGQQEMPAQVYPDDGVPLFVGHRKQHAVAQHTRLVHEDVQAAEMLDGSGEQGIRGGTLGNVAGSQDRLSARRLDLLHHTRGAIGDVVDHH